MAPAFPDKPDALAIIGIGCLFPRADGLSAFWANIANRVDAITEVPSTHWRTADYLDADPKSPDRVYTARGGFLDPIPFDCSRFGIAPNNLEATDTSQLLGLVAARQALLDAGYGDNGKPYDRRRVSVLLGVTGTLELVVPLGARLGHPLWRRALKEAGVADDVADDVVQRIADGYVPWQENSFPGLLGNVVAGRIANRLDLGGTNCVVDAACASSLSAVHLAALELQSGRADMVLTGGVDTFNDIFMYMCFSKTPALSPTGDARPFDADGDGTILGEGLGMLVLKRLADARRDGDRVYAVLRGIGSSSDGKGNAVYAPKAEGQMAALRSAYQDAGVTPDTIELVEGHGTGTKVGDATEVSALKAVFGEAGRDGTWCALGSVKSQLGHTKAAAGAAGLIKAACALYHKVLPPTIKVRRPLDVLRDGPFYINTEKRPWLSTGAHPRRAAVSAFGFGGSNFHCVLEEANPVKEVVDWDGDTQLVALSGDRTDVERQLNEWPTELPWPEFRVRAARTRQEWSPKAPFRLVFVVQRGKTDVARVLTNARTLFQPSGGRQPPVDAVLRGPDGIFLGVGQPQGKLAVLFPGQGAQYPGMLRDLVCHFPAAHAALADADRLFAASLDQTSRLSDRIYPISTFTDGEKQTQEQALQDTRIAQPALGAVSLGAWRVLERFGVRADAFAGHSYGEWTALAAAGRLADEEFHTLSALRGRLMAEAGGSGDAGTMLAVLAPAEIIERTLAEEALDLVLANRNAPDQTVLSGPTEVIARAEAAFAARQVRTRRLTVAAAFHSPLVAGAQRPLREALERAALPSGTVPVFANTTAAVYPDDPAAERDLLAGQLARPVEFVREIEALHASGVRCFLEVGPGARLSGLVEAILRGKNADCLALDASSGQRSGFHDVAIALAWLAAQGNSLRLDLWDDGFRPTEEASGKPGAVVPLVGANYVKPRTPRPAVVRTVVAPAVPVNGKREIPPAPMRQATPHMNGLRSDSDPLPAPRPATAVVPPPNVEPSALVQALQVTRDSLAALHALQERTAQLHRQFLEGQETSQRTVQVLVEQQQRLLQASLGAPVALPSIPPPPVAVPRPEPLPSRLPLAPEQPLRGLTPPVRPEPVPVVTPVAVAPAPVPSNGRVAQVLLEIVAEKTGYPSEMLELDMGLEADLGIDSIKRVEILSALQERLPDAPAVKPEHLGTLHTLRHIAAFLAGGDGANGPTKDVRPQVVPKQSAHAPRSPGSPTLPVRLETVQTVLLEIVAEKTGYPSEMLELDMGLESDLGIDSIKRVEILSALQERLPEAPAVKPEHLGTLHTLRHIAAFLANGEPGASATGESAAAPGGSLRSLTLPARQEPTTPLERSVVRVVPLTGRRETVRLADGAEVWVTSDDAELAPLVAERLRRRGLRPLLLPCADLVRRACPTSLGGLIVAPSTSTCDAGFLRDALLTAKNAGAALLAAGRAGGAVLATVSRLDGAFGFGPLDPQRSPLDGGLAGLAKTAAHEWPEVSCKAIDLAPTWRNTAAAADALVEELFLRGPVEVGLSPDAVRTLERVAQPLPPSGPAPLRPGDVVVISGGARGVTAEAAVALARAFRPTLVLLGRSPEPTTEPLLLADLSGEPELKRELNRLAGGSLSPRELGGRYRDLLAGRELRRNLVRITEAGAKVFYQPVDVRDTSAVAAVLATVRQQHGPVRGIVHGAGVLADARIEDKTAEQFDRVYGTKVDGLRALLAAVRPEELRVLALFSSTTARLGRVGQVDYAIANEVLNKIAQAEARRLPNCRVVSLNWGPWDGGMVNPSLGKLFASEGVGLIPLDAGADLLVRELSGNGERDVEVVVLARSPLVGQVSNLSGALDRLETCPTNVPPSAPTLSVAFERVLDLPSHPVLESHVLGGRPVLPLALALEWLGHAAMVQNSGLHFHGVDDLRVLHGVILENAAPVRLRVLAGKAVRRDGLYIVPAEIRGLRPDGRETAHIRCEVVLASELPPAPESRPTPEVGPYPHSREDMYRHLLFHGPHLHAIDRVDGCGPLGIVAALRTSPQPSAWIAQPLRSRWLSDPLAIDGAFQAAILWSLASRGAPNLPVHVAHYRQYRRQFPADGVRVSLRVTHAADLRAVSDLDFVDGTGKVVARLDCFECAIDAGLVKTFRRNRLEAAVS